MHVQLRSPLLPCCLWLQPLTGPVKGWKRLQPGWSVALTLCFLAGLTAYSFCSCLWLALPWLSWNLTGRFGLLPACLSFLFSEPALPHTFGFASSQLASFTLVGHLFYWPFYAKIWVFQNKGKSWLKLSNKIRKHRWKWQGRAGAD